MSNKLKRTLFIVFISLFLIVFSIGNIIDYLAHSPKNVCMNFSLILNFSALCIWGKFIYTEVKHNGKH